MIPRNFCTFRLDGHWYGIPVHYVREVLKHDETTPVPLARHEVRGLINLRGQIVTVIDLRRRLQLPDRDSSTHVIVEHRGEFVSFLVDSLGDVRELEGEQFELPPDTLRGPARELISGTYKTARELLTVLDVAGIADI